VWALVLMAGFLAALDPVRLGITLLVISRPRPVQNLLAYWVGCLIGSVPQVLIGLTVLHVTPMLKTLSQAWATSPTVRHIQIGMGVFALSIAALMIVHSLKRRRQRAHLLTPGGNTATLVLDSNTPTPLSRLLRRARGESTETGSVVQQGLRRFHNAWENGSLGVALVIGMVFGGPSLDLTLFVAAIILASGTAIGAQVSAAVAFVIGMLAVVEITLASYLIKPAKTQALVQLLHNWARSHRRQVLVAMCTVGGIALMAQGMGIIRAGR
jgi:hypothetical protein